MLSVAGGRHYITEDKKYLFKASSEPEGECNFSVFDLESNRIAFKSDCKYPSFSGVFARSIWHKNANSFFYVESYPIKTTDNISYEKAVSDAKFIIVYNLGSGQLTRANANRDLIKNSPELKFSFSIYDVENMEDCGGPAPKLISDENAFWNSI